MKKSKKGLDEDHTEVTGKYDLEELEEEYEAPQSGLEKFIQSQLPFLAKFLPKKKQAPLVDDYDDDEEEELQAEYEEELSQEEVPESKLMEGLKKQLPFLYNIIKKSQQKKSSPEKASKKDAAGEPQKKVKPIHIVIGIGLVYLFYTELFQTEEGLDPVVDEAPVVSEPAPTPTPSEPLPQEEPPPTYEEPTYEEPTWEDTPSEEPTPSFEEPTWDEIPSEEPTPSFEEPTTAPEEPVWDTPTPSEVNSTTDDFNFDLEEDEANMGGEQSSEGTLLENNDIEEQDITTSILRNLEDKVRERKEEVPVEVVEPTEAPDYDYKGRALVYNCQGGHWACVDDESFKSCRRNYAWNSSQNLEKECYAAEVYASEADCARAQTMKIDSVASVEFCN